MELGVVFLWLLLSLAVGLFAARRGRSSVGWCLVSLAISPLLGLVFLLAVGPAADAARAPCPFCAEAVKVDAVLCPHCRSDLSARAAASRRRLAPVRDVRFSLWWLLIGAGLPLLGMLLIWIRG